MIETIVYILIGIFLWSIFGVIIACSMMFSKEQRSHIKQELQKNPNYLIDVFCGCALLGPITLIILGYGKIKVLCQNYDYKDDV